MKALVTIGTFDGVHRGHQKLVRWVLTKAKKLHLRPTVVVLDKPPRFFFKPELATPLLTTPEERRELLGEMGVQSVRILPFNKHLANVPHTRFFDDYLIRKCRAGGLFVGPDFAFGKRRKGDIPWMSQACALLGLEFGILPLVTVDGRKIGSTHIRELLLQGKVDEVARWLGRPHFVQGVVVRGQHVGRQLGFPTANVDVPESKLAPAGVYKVRVMGERMNRIGACNVGVRPTLGGTRRVVEAHIPGWSKSLYGRRLRLEFLSKIRAEKKFPSLEALRAQIARDVASLA